MKKQVTCITVALFASLISATSASAEYYISTQQEGNTIKADVVAEGATLSAMEFIVDMPEDIKIIDSYNINGSVFNQENGHFAWASIETPTDGTVMYSVTFTVKDNYKDELSIIPVEGFKQDLSKTFTVPVSYKEADKESSSDISDVISSSSEVSDISTPDSETSDINNSDSDTSINKDENASNPNTGNPNTGIALCVVPIVGIVGATAITLVRKNKKN